MINVEVYFIFQVKHEYPPPFIIRHGRSGANMEIWNSSNISRNWFSLADFGRAVMYQGMTYLSRLGCRHVSNFTFEKFLTLEKNDKKLQAGNGTVNIGSETDNIGSN